MLVRNIICILYVPRTETTNYDCLDCERSVEVGC